MLAGWLSEFPLRERALGREAYADGGVRDLIVTTTALQTINVSAHVTFHRTYFCTISHGENQGWRGNCPCSTSGHCEHLFATGTAALDYLNLENNLSLPHPFQSRPPALPVGHAAEATATSRPKKKSLELEPAQSPEEASLIAQLTAANGVAPNNKQQHFLRNLLILFANIGHPRGYRLAAQALQNLTPNSHYHGFFYQYQSPFENRWSEPPKTSLELWSHLALLFVEKNIPIPPFMSKVTDIAWARSILAAHLRAREIASWRHRFAQLEKTYTSAPIETPTASLRALRLRLAHPRVIWELSEPSGSPASPPIFNALSTQELKNIVENPEKSTATLEPASTSLATMLYAYLSYNGQNTSFKFISLNDRKLLGRLLNHPNARTCIVNAAGEPLIRDPRRLIWQFNDHPEDPLLAHVELGFADGTPAPFPLIRLPGPTDLYLHHDTVFTGMAPPSEQENATTKITVPRAALSLPEAGRFAAQAGLKLPGNIENRFRTETLRARLRAQLSSRHPSLKTPQDEIVILELAAIDARGAVHAIYETGTWRTQGPGITPSLADRAFVILDFKPTLGAIELLYRSPAMMEPSLHGGNRAIINFSDRYFIEQFPAWLAGFPPETLIELAPELTAFAQTPTRAHFSIDLTPDTTSGIDWFDVHVTLRAEDTTLTPEDIAILLSARGRFVRLEGRGWRRLIVEDSPATKEKLARLGLNPNQAETSTHEPLRLHALQLADEALRDALPEKLWAQVRDRSAALRSSPPPPLPTGLVADLRPYQQEGFHFLAFLAENNFGGVLADDMGLGKTLQTLAWLLWLAENTTRASSTRPAHRPFRALVVCPKSVVVNWQLETARFAPTLTTTRFTSDLIADLPPGPSATKTPTSPFAALKTHLLVANYTQLRLHAEAFASESWDAVILDEGQNIKNPASTTAQAARALRTSQRLVLTGTPIENRLLDLWSLFAFAQPGLLGGQTSFKRLFNDKEDPAGAHQRLANRVKHFLLRRTKSQVAQDLPPRIEEELIVELEGDQRRLYDAELKRTRALLLGVKSSREFDSQRFNILQSLLRLRQICCDPRLIGAGQLPKSKHLKSPKKGSANRPEPSPESPPSPSAKLEALLDTLEPLVAQGHKVLVFSQFVTMLELIRMELNARGIAHLLLTGQTENRQDLVDKFQDDPTTSVFLLSLKAAGSGLNLTAASYVVLFDPWWNPAVEAQAIDRTHRIGQKSQVIAYRLIARDTIEEKIRALQREKAALAAAVVHEESLATVLDLESLRRILA